MKTISFDTYPHILDAVLEHAPHGSLLVLRATCKSIRDRADAILVSHIAAFCAHGRIAAVRDGRHWRIPRLGWLNVPELADSVRCVDICTGQDDDEEAPADSKDQTSTSSEEQTAEEKDKEPTSCWCIQYRSLAPPFNKYLAGLLHRVRLVRRWGTHGNHQAIATPRTVTFYTALPPQWSQPHHLATIECPVNVVHVGYWNVPSFETFPYSKDPTSDLVIRCTSVRTLPPSITNALPGAAERLLEDTAASELARAEGSLNLYPHPLSPAANAIYELTATVSSKLTQGASVTLVGLEDWPLELPTSDGDIRVQLERGLKTCLVQFNGFDERDALDLIARKLVVMTEDEYRDSIGDDIYDLEAFTPQALHVSG